MANKKRLIDAYKLENLLQSNSARYHHKDDVIAAIAGQPTVDAVEVVRCCDCVYCNNSESTYCIDSRPVNGTIRRRRKCANCGYRFSTIEVELECYRELEKTGGQTSGRIKELLAKEKLLSGIIEYVNKGPKK